MELRIALLTIVVTWFFLSLIMGGVYALLMRRRNFIEERTCIVYVCNFCHALVTDLGIAEHNHRMHWEEDLTGIQVYKSLMIRGR